MLICVALIYGSANSPEFDRALALAKVMTANLPIRLGKRAIGDMNAMTRHLNGTNATLLTLAEINRGLESLETALAHLRSRLDTAITTLSPNGEEPCACAPQSTLIPHRVPPMKGWKPWQRLFPRLTSHKQWRKLRWSPLARDCSRRYCDGGCQSSSGDQFCQRRAGRGTTRRYRRSTGLDLQTRRASAGRASTKFA
jgi:hypothetical protein